MAKTGSDKNTDRANGDRDDLELEIEARAGVSQEMLMAEAVINPIPRNAMLVGALGKGAFGGPAVSLTDATALVTSAVVKVAGGDLSTVTAMLTAQAMTLDATFTEFTRRAANNMGQYPEAVDRYMRLALKAQGQSRTTVEALAKIVRGNEQVVKHVYVDNRGGQAVIAETVQAGGGAARIAGQPYEPSAALPCADPAGYGVPLPCDARKEPVPAARRQVDGSAEG